MKLGIFMLIFGLLIAGAGVSIFVQPAALGGIIGEPKEELIMEILQYDRDFI